MRHLFGIGVTESPILQTMRQRVAKRIHIYKAFRRPAKIGIFSFLRRFANIGKLTLSSF